jgi:hypothetical protein
MGCNYYDLQATSANVQLAKGGIRFRDSASIFEIRDAADTSYASMRANDGTFDGSVLIAGGTVAAGVTGATSIVIGDGSGSDGMTVVVDTGGAGAFAVTDIAGTSRGSLTYRDIAVDWVVRMAGVDHYRLASTAIIPSDDNGHALGVASTNRFSESHIVAGYFAGADAGDAHANADDVVIGDGTGNPGATIFGATDANLFFSNGVGVADGGFTYEFASDIIRFRTANGNRVSLTATLLQPVTTGAITLGGVGAEWSDVRSVLGTFSSNVTVGGTFSLTAANASLTLGDGTGTPNLILNKSDAATGAGVDHQNAGFIRWRTGMDGSENWGLHRFNGAGVFQESTIVDQSTHGWDFPATVDVTGLATFDANAILNSASPILTIGDGTGDGRLIIDKADLSEAQVARYENAGVIRWAWHHFVSENLGLRRYNASGVLVDTMTVNQSTGSWTFPAEIIGQTNLSLTGGAPVLTVGDGLAGTKTIAIDTENAAQGQLRYHTAGAIRWNVAKIATTDNYAIERYTGASSFQGTPFLINSSDATVTINGATIASNADIATAGSVTLSASFLNMAQANPTAFIGDGTGTPVIVMNKSATASTIIRLRDVSVTRWEYGMSGFPGPATQHRRGERERKLRREPSPHPGERWSHLSGHHGKYGSRAIESALWKRLHRGGYDRRRHVRRQRTGHQQGQRLRGELRLAGPGRPAIQVETPDRRAPDLGVVRRGWRQYALDHQHRPERRRRRQSPVEHRLSLRD